MFGGFNEFQRINPVVKAPTLVCDDGSVLMDSSLILQWLESAGARNLIPTDATQRPRSFRIIGLALAACEKTVQIVYERELRPPEKQHVPWLDRVHAQLLAAYAESTSCSFKRHAHQQHRQHQHEHRDQRIQHAPRVGVAKHRQ